MSSSEKRRGRKKSSKVARFAGRAVSCYVAWSPTLAWFRVITPTLAIIDLPYEVVRTSDQQRRFSKQSGLDYS
jgi:hypothetical protein